MHITVLNISLLLAWMLITAGSVMLNVGAGLVASGSVLAVFALYLAHRFGVYASGDKDKTKGA